MSPVELTTLVAFASIGVTLTLAGLAAAVIFGRLSQRVTHLEHGLGEIRAEMATLRSEMRAEMADLRAEMATLRSEMRSEMADLRTEMRSEMADLRTEMRALRAELERTNLILVGLANHRHDTDGTTLFSIPQP